MKSLEPLQRQMDQQMLLLPRGSLCSQRGAYGAPVTGCGTIVSQAEPLLGSAGLQCWFESQLLC